MRGVPGSAKRVPPGDSCSTGCLGQFKPAAQDFPAEALRGITLLPSLQAHQCIQWPSFIEGPAVGI
jgi:hypothetical protein